MSYGKLCRVCLSSNVCLYVIVGTPLQHILENLLNSSVSVNDGKPNFVCYICKWQLTKAYNLMARVTRSNNYLHMLLQNGVPVTEESIPLTTQHSLELVHKLAISQLEHFSTNLNAAATDDHIEVPLKEESLVVKKENGEDYDLLENLSTDVRIALDDDQKEDLIIKEEDLVKKENCNDSDLEVSAGGFTDSEDDIPLQNLNLGERKKLRKIIKKNTVKKKKKVHLDFAREIILSHEEQLKELEERSKSLNYKNAPLKCTMCYRGFVDMRAYENHMRKHQESSGSYSCEVCQMRYQSMRNLRIHVVTSHSQRYACNKCGHASHTANQARDHEKWHSGFTYECKLCGQKFSKPTSYLTHKRKRHPSKHVCNICGDSFVGKHGLLMHKSKTHKDRTPSDNQEEPAAKRFCSECNIQFATMDAWKRHVLSSYVHTRANEDSYHCKICEINIESSTTFSFHVKEHRRTLRMTKAVPVDYKPVAELVCDQCGSHFVNKSKLQAHVKRAHLGLKYNKNIVCEVCGKKCTSNASLRYHQRTHTGERPYQCVTCLKRFADSNQLRIHNRSHTGERPYCCAQCGKRFSQKPALNRHYRVHTGAKPYPCQFCSKKFSQSNSMKIHVKSVHLKTPNKRRNNDQKTSTDNLQSL